MTPQWDMSLVLSPLVVSLAPAEILLLSELSTFLSLLPSAHQCITNPRLLLFGSESKRSQLLRFELQRFQAFSIPLRSLRLTLPLFELCCVDPGTQSQPMIRLRIEEAGSDPNSGILEIQSIRLTAGEKDILALPHCRAVFQRNSPVSPSVSTFSEFLESKHRSKEAVFIDVPSKPSSFAQFFQTSLAFPRCSLAISVTIPAVTISLEQQSVLPVLQFLQFLQSGVDEWNSVSLPSLPFFIPAVYETPLLGVSLRCPSVSLHVSADLFQWKERSRFVSLSLSDLTFSGFFGAQNCDLSLQFASLQILLRFIHLALPLTQETLTGYDETPLPHDGNGEIGETVETESWEAAKLRYVSLPSREIELLSVDSSRFHVSTSLHVLPSSHTWLLAAGEQSHSRVQLCEIGLGSRIRADCDLGMIELVWDDVGLADLVWAILTFCDLLALLLPSASPVSPVSPDSLDSPDSPDISEKSEKSEKSEEPTDSTELGKLEKPVGAELFCSDCLFQFTSPLLALRCVYNQKPFQEILVPAVFFEFGFSEIVETGEVFPAQFVCGVQTRGAYWTDLTNDLSTSEVFVASRAFL